jgi:hypothetical protein
MQLAIFLRVTQPDAAGALDLSEDTPGRRTFLSHLLLTGCTRLEAMPAAPPQTAATWLTALRAGPLSPVSC